MNEYMNGGKLPKPLGAFGFFQGGKGPSNVERATEVSRLQG